MLKPQRPGVGVQLVLLALLSACGGGGGGAGNGGTPGLPAPSGLSYPSPPAYVVNQGITALTPSVAGQVTAYSVAPALPAGLGINATTGVISGTPTTVTALANYTVTASNASGSITATVAVVVNDVAPNINYTFSLPVFVVNLVVDTSAPTNTGGEVVSWSVSPALPAGLQLNNADGSITGVPTAVAASTTYTVTATNSGGSSTATFQFAVDTPLLDLGHVSPVTTMKFANSRLLSRDQIGHWILQDFASGTTLLSGDSPCVPPGCTPAPFSSADGKPYVLEPIDLAGNVMINVTTTALQVRDTSDGHLLATISGQPSWWLLASDGSYVCAGSMAGLMAWSTSGELLVSRSGNYSSAVAFAAPGQINVALGPAGSNVIESVVVASGTDVVSPTFQGQFSTWFADGSAFLTNLGTMFWTYSPAAVQEDMTYIFSYTSNQSSTVGGLGGWFWVGAYLYKVGASITPALTLGGPVIPSGTTIAVLATGGSQGSPQFQVIDLSGSTPQLSTPTAPITYLDSYAAISSTEWVVGNQTGLIVDGTSTSQPRYLTLGPVGIVGGSEYFSIAAAAEILNYAANTNSPLQSIALLSSRLSMSSDGTVLAAIGYTMTVPYPSYPNAPFNALNVYSLPSGALINGTFPTTSCDSSPCNPNITALAGSTSLSSSGSVLLDVYCTYTVSNGTSLACIPFRLVSPQLSPDGTLIAASTTQDGGGTFSIYQNGTLVTTAVGTALGWLDNSRVLAIIKGEGSVVIYDSSGNNLGFPNEWPLLQSFQLLSANTVYVPAYNRILSVTDGTIWTGEQNINGVGAVSGSEAVYSIGSYVVTAPIN